MNSIDFINENAEKRIPFYNLFKLVIIHLYISHLCACLMYSIAIYEADINPHRNMVLSIYFFSYLKHLDYDYR